MPYDNEYNRMLARDIEYFNRKYVAHSDATGQGTIDYRSSYSDNKKLGGGAGCAEYKLNGGAILGLQDGTVMGGPKIKTPSRAIISTFSSLGAPLQPASGVVVTAASSAPNIAGTVRQVLEEKQLYGRGQIGGQQQSSPAELKKLLDQELKKEQSKLDNRTKNYAEKDANKEVDKAISAEIRGGGSHNLGQYYGGAGEGVSSMAEVRKLLNKEIKTEENTINEKTHAYNVREAEKEVKREVAAAKRNGSGVGGFLGALARKAAPMVKRAAVNVAKNVGQRALSAVAQRAQDYFMPQEPPAGNEPHQSHLDYESDSSSSESSSTYDESESSTDTDSIGDSPASDEDEEGDSEEEEREERANRSSGKSGCPPSASYNDASKPRASNVGAKSRQERPKVTRTNFLENTEKPPTPKKDGAGKKVKKEKKEKKVKEAKGGSFITSVPASKGLQDGPKVKSEMKGSYMSGGNKPKRAEIVKKIMKEKGISMIEASKYVKQHNLY